MKKLFIALPLLACSLAFLMPADAFAKFYFNDSRELQAEFDQLVKDVFRDSEALLSGQNAPCIADLVREFHKRSRSSAEYGIVQELNRRLMEIGTMLESLKDAGLPGGKELDPGWLSSLSDMALTHYTATGGDREEFITRMTGEPRGFPNVSDWRKLYQKILELDAYLRRMEIEGYDEINSDMPQFLPTRCRFLSKVVVGSNGLAYPSITFGGLMGYEIACDCEKRSSDRVKDAKLRIAFHFKARFKSREVNVLVNDEYRTFNVLTLDVAAPAGFRWQENPVINCCPPYNGDDEITLQDEIKAQKDYLKKLSGGDRYDDEDDEGKDDYYDNRPSGGSGDEGGTGETEPEEEAGETDNEDAAYQDETAAIMEDVYDNVVGNFDTYAPVGYTPVSTSISAEYDYSSSDIYGVGALPSQFIATSFGFGYDGQNDEIGICVGVDYLHQLSPCEKAALYLGGGAMLDFTKGIGDFNDFTKPVFMFGPKAELLVPIGESAVSVKTGLSGGFGVGVDKFGDLKYNLQLGYLDVTAGLYVNLPKVDFCLDAPLFQYQHIKQKDDFASLTDNNIGFMLNKRMPLKASLAIPLGQDKPEKFK